MTRRDLLKALGVNVTGFISLIFIPGSLFAHTNNKRKQFVILLGDSIRMNYQETVEKKLQNKATVWAPKENCQDTVFVLNNLKKWLDDKTPDIIHLNCGLHDVYIEYDGNPRRTREAYAENLNKIFSILTEKFKNTKIIFALTTPVNEESQKTSEMYGRLVRRNSDIDAINKVAVDTCNKYRIRIDNLHSDVMAGGIEKLICEDGVHLNKKGEKYIGKQVAENIEDVLLG